LLRSQTNKHNHYHSRQFSSSDQSPQLLRPLQTKDARMQRSMLGHLNSSDVLHAMLSK